MVSELHDLVLQAGTYQYLAKRAKELFEETKTRLASLPNGDTVAGRFNDQIVAKASWVKGRQSVKITDDKALLEWVKEHHPEEVIESVNPAFIQAFKPVGDVVLWNGEPVPGAEVKQGAPYLAVKGNDETPFLVAQIIKGGQVSLDGVKALENKE